jgi:hypothetical protein
MPGHSIALALARTAAEVTGGKAAVDVAAANWEAAPGTPRRLSEPLSRMNSLPDLDSDSCSDSSDSNDEEAGPSTPPQQRGVSSAVTAHGGQARSVKPNGDESLMRQQPLLWMGCTCHWQVCAA